MSDYFSCGPDPAAVAQTAQRFGFCLVKNVFTQAEMARLEQGLSEEARALGSSPDDIYSCPTLRWVMLDRRVVDIAKGLLGDELVYYRQSDMAYEETPGPATFNLFRELHCDARGTPKTFFKSWNPVGQEMFGAYRFAIYFRNYRDFSGGLKVAVGSHRLRNEALLQFNNTEVVAKLPTAIQWFGETALTLPVAPLELYNVASMPGDLVIFNLRCFHAAGAVRMKDRPSFATLPLIEDGIQSVAPQLCLPIPPGPRNAIFFDYGMPSQETDLYAKWRGLNAPSKRSNPALDPPTLPGISLRNDKVIVALAERVSGHMGGSAPATDQLSPEVRHDCNRLAELCHGYQPFSPHHPLFDADRFERLRAADPTAAGVHVAREIAGKRADLIRSEKELRSNLAKQAT